MISGACLVPAALDALQTYRDDDDVRTRAAVYYLLHIPVIHLAAIAVSLGREGQINPWLFGNHPLAPPPVPEGDAWSLMLF